MFTGRDIPKASSLSSASAKPSRRWASPPLLGRNLGPSDSPDGRELQPVVTLHYRFWQRHFNGDPTVVGKLPIIGATRLNFTWGWGADVYLPQGNWQRLGWRSCRQTAFTGRWLLVRRSPTIWSATLTP
jgi:putative ABC transport system permease protein